MANEKRFSVPEEILKALLDVVNAGQYPNVPYGDITRVLEALRKNVEEVPDTAGLKTEINQLKNQVDGAEKVIKDLEEEIEGARQELEESEDALEESQRAVDALSFRIEGLEK